MTFDRLQAQPKVTVWCGVIATRILCPFLLRDTMNAERCLQMLDNYLWPAVSGWGIVHGLIFMEDGAPPHFALSVRAWLDQHFSRRWIGRDTDLTNGLQEAQTSLRAISTCEVTQ